MSEFHPRTRGGFLERTLESLHAAMERALYAETAAARRGVMQRLDPRVKVAGMFSLVVSVALALKLWPIAVVLLLAVIVAAASSIPVSVLAGRAWLGAAIFSGLIAAPAIFLVPGTPVYGLPISAQGIRTATVLVMRAVTAATLMLVLVYTTPWTHVLKSLRVFRLPVVLVVIFGMTCRYILLMLDTAHQMFESRKSRTVNSLTSAVGYASSSLFGVHFGLGALTVVPRVEIRWPSGQRQVLENVQSDQVHRVVEPK